MTQSTEQPECTTGGGDSGKAMPPNQPAPAPDALASQQVAEARCPCSQIPNRIDLEECNTCDTADDGQCYNSCADGCNGTGLRYPELSRECEGCLYASRTNITRADGTKYVLNHCDRCGGTNRVADVTEGKLWVLVGTWDREAQYRFARYLCESIGVRGSVGLPGERFFVAKWCQMTEAERLEALSAALLAAGKEE